MKPWARNTVETMLVLNLIMVIGQVLDLIDVPDLADAYFSGFAVCGVIVVLGSPFRRPAAKVTVKANEVKSETKSL